MPVEWTIRGARLLDDRHDHDPADVRVRNGRIERIAPQLEPAANDLDAGGLVLAPGFIDIHCHLSLIHISEPTRPY